ncbi:hypothetical protein DGWBC_0319 [Dehalogenimonas sp. WBC-2]|nr:hypothetical protein DGWBC_0319 [Dehalogenimonas sp. WBC-2]
METRFRALLRALPVMLLAALALTATAAPVSATVSPPSGIVGSALSISQTGVANSTAYTVYFAQSGTDRASAGSVTSSGTGVISASVQVPALPTGTYEVWLRPATGTAYNAGSFAIAPSLTIAPTSAAVGTTVSVIGNGFAANSIMAVYFGSLSTPAVQTTSNPAGSFSAQFTVPSVPRSLYTIYARDSSFNIAYASPGLTVTPGIATISAATGKVGDTITLTGGGFTASGSVSIFWNNSDGTALATVNADSNGSINANIIIPAAVRGAHNIIARDISTTTNTPGKQFTVTPKIVLNPSTGAVGSSISVTGTGFGESTSISFEWDGTAIAGVTAATTNSTGSFTKTFNIPTAISGEHTITARDASSSAEAVYTLAAKITLTPTSGTSGIQVSLSGSGFHPGVTITITYDNTVLSTAPGNIVSLANGTFSASFTVPGGVAGNHTVTASDGLGNTATSSFTSTLSADISPVTSTASPGNVGQDLTITGIGFLPNAAITVKFGNDTVGSATSSATGAFTVTFKVPAVTAGSYTINVTDGANSRPFTFVMEGVAPAAPVLTLPSNIEKPKQPIVYEWGAVTDPSGVTYTLEVGNDSTFGTVFMQKTGLTTTSYTATDAEKLPSVSKDAPYYWRVFATDGAGNVGAASTPQTFTVGFSFADFFGAIPVWAWAVIGVFVVVIIGGLIYYFYRRGATY